MERKQVFDAAIATGKPPTPYAYCKEWECKYCRFATVCEALGIADGMTRPEVKA